VIVSEAGFTLSADARSWIWRLTGIVRAVHGRDGAAPIHLEVNQVIGGGHLDSIRINNRRANKSN
jgi:hypothetical protein